MRVRFLTVAGLLGLVLPCGSGAAQERPDIGLLYNTSDISSLTYRCRQDRADLECSFLQASVRKKATTESLAKVLERARKQFPAFKRDIGTQCQGLDEMHDAIVLGRPPSGADAARMKPPEKAYLVKFIGMWRDLCVAPTEAKFVEYARLTHDKDTRTCSVSSNSFEQRFRRVETNGPWVVTDQPSGPCGIINVSRFEKEQGGITFWKYFSKKVITNPRGEALPGLACSGLDEREYLYDWRSREIFLQCDYIVFSPL